MFNNLKKIVLLVALVFSFSENSLAKKERKTISKDTLKSVTKALEVNEELHASFFKYDGAKIEKNSKELQNSISAIKDPEISKLLDYAKKQLSEITAKKKKEENYETYHVVSMALIHVVNTYDVGSKYNAYSCPMVKKKWLQNSKKMKRVHNPYADYMPHCGSQVTRY